jgi:hypothetical protein
MAEGQTEEKDTCVIWYWKRTLMGCVRYASTAPRPFPSELRGTSYDGLTVSTMLEGNDRPPGLSA